MQNNVQIYERKYNNIFDLFSEIGGVVQVIFYLFYWINFLYNKYVIAYDTNSLFFSIKDNNPIADNDNRANSFDGKRQSINKKLFNLKHNIKIPTKAIRSSKYNFFNIDEQKENSNPKMKININYSNNNIKNNNIIHTTNNFINTNNKDDDDIGKIDSPKKGENKFNTHFNSSNLFLKDNNNSILMNKLKKENNTFDEVYKKMDFNKVHESGAIKANNDYIKKLFVSRGGISKMIHRKMEAISDEKLNTIKYFSPIDF